MALTSPACQPVPFSWNTENTKRAVRAYLNHSNEGLLAVHLQYLREYRADPRPETLFAVEQSSVALSARGL